MSENVCTACGGDGQQWSGVEYFGQHEIVGCDECWGTGFDDVLAGVDDLRAEISRLRAVIEEARAFEMQFTELKMPEIRALDAILNRGLKGAGDGSVH